MTKLKAFKKFLHLPQNVKFLFFEAVFFALKFRLYTSILPYRIWIKNIDTKNISSTEVKNEEIIVKDAFRAVRRSTKYLPFKEKCLIESLVLKKMLQRRNIHIKMSLGLSRNKNKELIAHAWTSYNGKMLTGARNAMNFVEIKHF